MSLPYTSSKTLRGGNTYDLNARLEMFAHGEDAMEGDATDTNEQTDEGSARVSTDIFEEQI